MITPENVLTVQHQDWLQHPVTKQHLANLEKHKQMFVKSLSNSAGNVSEFEIYFRLQAYGIRTLDAVITQTKNTIQFIEQTEKQ
jgi:hypothetical protein